MGTPWEKAKKKERGTFGKSPPLRRSGHSIFCGHFAFKMPNNQTANQKEKQWWVNVPSNYTKNKFGAGLEEEVERLVLLETQM